MLKIKLMWTSLALALCTVHAALAFNQADVDRLLADRSCPGGDLKGAILRNEDLTEANLDGADLSYANLNGAVLEKASLKGANLIRVTLSSIYSKCGLQNKIHCNAS